ncbi:hypothetical protein ACEV6Q_27095 [Enterobacter ludwigii]|uniref:hypothetical protein n=1 Tax=Enterobacter ludwigii TaxID=299767 RepID=UPI003BEEDACB
MNDNKLTEAQLLFRLQQFHGAELEATEMGDHEFAHECADVASIIRELQEYRKAAGEPVMYQYRFFEQKNDKWGGWHDCGGRDFEMFYADAQIPDSGVQVRRLYTSPQLAPVVLDALVWMRNIVSDPRTLPRRKEWVSGQQYSYVLLDNVKAMVEEACSACHASVIASSPQDVTP